MAALRLLLELVRFQLGLPLGLPLAPPLALPLGLPLGLAPLTAADWTLRTPDPESVDGGIYEGVVWGHIESIRVWR